jgi:hypothetical protein
MIWIISIVVVLIVLWILLMPAVLCALTEEYPEAAQDFLSLETFLWFYRNLPVKWGWVKKSNVEYKVCVYGDLLDGKVIEDVSECEIELPWLKSCLKINPYRHGVFNFNNANLLFSSSNSEIKVRGCDRVIVICKPKLAFNRDFFSTVTILIEKLSSDLFFDFHGEAINEIRDETWENRTGITVLAPSKQTRCFLYSKSGMFIRHNSFGKSGKCEIKNRHALSRIASTNWFSQFVITVKNLRRLFSKEKWIKVYPFYYYHNASGETEKKDKKFDALHHEELLLSSEDGDYVDMMHEHELQQFQRHLQKVSFD